MCFHQCTKFPQDCSEDLSTIPLRVLSSGPKFLGKSEGRREPSRVGRRVAGLRSSQGNRVRPGFSISATWYLRILWSDIHKWPLPFRSCFTWWLVKIFFPQEGFKAPSIKTATAGRFQRQERFLPNKGVGYSGTTRNWWENICPSQQWWRAQMNLLYLFFL